MCVCVFYLLSSGLTGGRLPNNFRDLVQFFKFSAFPKEIVHIPQNSLNIQESSSSLMPIARILNNKYCCLLLSFFSSLLISLNTQPFITLPLLALLNNHNTVESSVGWA